MRLAPLAIQRSVRTEFLWIVQPSYEARRLQGIHAICGLREFGGLAFGMFADLTPEGAQIMVILECG